MNRSDFATSEHTKPAKLCFVGQAANRHEMPVGACPGKDELLLVRNVFGEERGNHGQQAGRAGALPYRSRAISLGLRHHFGSFNWLLHPTAVFLN
jgi:hypothetical protein